MTGSNGNKAVAGFTLVELLVVIAVISILAAMLMPALARARESARRANCASNLRQVGMALEMYANEQEGNFPTIQRYIGDNCAQKNTNVFMFDGLSVFPEYLTEARVLTCPSNPVARSQFFAGSWSRPDGPGGGRRGGSTNPCLLDDTSYIYVGWLLRTEFVAETGTRDLSQTFVQAFQKVLNSENVALLDQTWSFTNEIEKQIEIKRLCHGLERFLIEDINNPSKTSVSQSVIPILFDRIDIDPSGFNHVPGGGNVLYLDGHADYVRYPDEFPLNRAWAEFVDLMNI